MRTLANNLMLLLQSFRLRDLVDMLVVWFVIYRVLLLIKRTRAVQMLSGLGILAIAYIVSIWAELFTLNWLLEKFFVNLFIIIVVLFQHEIRRGLAHIGRNPFFTNVSADEETLVVDEIVKAAVILAQKKIGALIVIEREIGLEDFVEVGTKIDSTVNAELINAIFVNHSPIHDGALIVRGGRITAAGCFLPLTRNPSIDKNLGTRHRAAIGLTEETDAVVLVVSEENMSISIVQGGHITPDLDMPRLRKTLYEAFSLSQAYTQSTGATS
ncbi:MAG: TIGR00159 family protein [Oligoflexia bacterium]|nr:TIGR00159 family protein [Oligoflexia bacterium]